MGDAIFQCRLSRGEGGSRDGAIRKEEGKRKKKKKKSREKRKKKDSPGLRVCGLAIGVSV